MSIKSGLQNSFLIFSFLLLVFLGCNGDGGGRDRMAPPPEISQNKLNVEIVDAEVSSDRKPIVTLRLTDDMGNPVNRNDVSMNFIIARIERGQDQYFDYITRVQTSNGVSALQASSEGSDEGTFQELGDGVLRYAFDTILPSDFDREATHTIGIYATRTIGSLRFVSNDTFDFVPSGGNGTGIREVVVTQACNTCHDPVEAHGGSRRDVELCVLCHSTQIADPDTGEVVEQIDPDTGNTIGFEVMIHKIHRGENLPSVEAGMPYQIIGFRESVHDYSTVVFPQDIRNCTKCHTDEASQSHHFMTDLSRSACGSCHDDVDFAMAENHPVVQLTDNNCSGCHLPSTGQEFDISVTGAHTVPQKSRELAGVNFRILDVRSTETGSSRVAPGGRPEITFSIKTDNGEVIDPSEMDFLRFTLSGPTTDYKAKDYDDDGLVEPVEGIPLEEEEYFVQENVGDNATPDGSGNFVYTFNTSVPTSARGTYTVGIEGYQFVTVGGESKILIEEVRDVGRNEVFDFPVTDSEAVPRRMVVDNTLCSDCHGEFSKDFLVHGGIRNNVNYCVQCHNASADDIAVRPIPETGETDMTASIHFKKMIHMIHTGEELTNKPYVIFGFGGRPHVFSEVRYPGDRRNCQACHLPETFILDPGKGVLGPEVLSTTEREIRASDSNKIVTETFLTTPVITACVSCHDDLGVTSVFTSGNMVTNMLTGENHIGGAQPEGACIDCHIAGDPLGAEEAHIPPIPPAERINRPQ